MARKAKNFDAFKLKLNKNQSREQAVDEALRLLEEDYFTSDDLSEVEEQEKDDLPSPVATTALVDGGNKAATGRPESEVSAEASNPEKRFKELSSKIKARRKKNDPPNEEVLDDVLRLLENARLNSDDALRVRRKRRTFTAVLSIFTGLALIFIAAALIILELPAWLKGPTLFRFSVHDGVTMSDLIAMGSIGIGTVLFIIGFAEFKRTAG